MTVQLRCRSSDFVCLRQREKISIWVSPQDLFFFNYLYDVVIFYVMVINFMLNVEGENDKFNMWVEEICMEWNGIE